MLGIMGSLEQDYTTVPGQLYACISLVGPDCPQKNEKFGLKIRGCFNSRDEAASHAKRLQKEDATFDIYVVDMYKWLLIPPDRDHIEDVHYNDEKLEEIMSKYRENQAMASKMFEERKRDLMAKPTGTDMPYIKPGDENSKYYTKPDEPPISHPADIIEKLTKENPNAPIEELVKEADAIVAKEIEERKKAREAELQKVDEDNLKVIEEAEESATADEEKITKAAEDATDLNKLEKEFKKKKKKRKSQTKSDVEKTITETAEAENDVKNEMDEDKRIKAEKDRLKAEEFNARMDDDARRKSTDQERNKKGGMFSKMFWD